MAGDAGDAGEEARKAAVMKPGVGGVFVRMACCDEGLDGSYIIYKQPRTYNQHIVADTHRGVNCLWLLAVGCC